MNLSKIYDSRFWSRWQKSGAVVTVRRPVLYVGQGTGEDGDCRPYLCFQYRISDTEVRISDSDCRWVADEPGKFADILFLESRINPGYVAKTVGQTGLRFLRELIKAKGFRMSKLWIVSAWQFQVFPFPEQTREEIDRMVLPALQTILGTKPKILPEPRSFGTVYS